MSAPNLEPLRCAWCRDSREWLVGLAGSSLLVCVACLVEARLPVRCTLCGAAVLGSGSTGVCQQSGFGFGVHCRACAEALNRERYRAERAAARCYWVEPAADVPALDVGPELAVQSRRARGRR